MKKVLAILCALAMTVSCLSASMFAFAADNLALDATPTSGYTGNNEDAKDPIINIVDGQSTTKWQVIDGKTTDEKNFAASKDGYTSAILTWDEEIEFNRVIAEIPNITYNEADPTASGFYLKAGNEVLYPSVSKTDIVFTMDLAESVKSATLEVVFVTTDNAYYPDVYEIEVYNLTGSPYDTANVVSTKTAIDKAFGQSNSYGYTQASWDVFAAARQTLDDAITACTNKIVGEVEAYPDQASLDACATAVYAAIDALELETASKNVLYRAEMYYDASNIGQWSSGLSMMAVTDGDLVGNDNRNWQINSKKDSMYFHLVNAASMNEIVLFTEYGDYSVNVYYTTADVDALNSYEEMAAIEWTAVSNQVEKYGEAKPGYIAIGFDTISNVTGLKVEVNSDMWYTAKVYEVEAYLDGANDNCFTGTKEFASGTSRFVATNVTKEAIAEGKVIKAEYTITRGELSATGVRYISNAYSFVQLGEGDSAIYVKSSDISNGHGGDYVTGILFTGVSDGDAFNVVFSVVDASEVQE